MAIASNSAAKASPASAARPRLLAYEQPLSERIRTFLRLELLFDQASHHLQGDMAADSRAALSALLDIQTLVGKGDIRTELLKEMERQATQLTRWQHREDVDNVRLRNTLETLGKLRARLEAPSTQIGRALRDSEFLAALRNRSSIPGGTCGFDVPGLHHWLHQDARQRRQDLQNWLATLDHVMRALRLVLMLLRESATTRAMTAEQGVLQMNLDTNGGQCQLVRVLLPAEETVFPEISGGKHRFVIRFMERPNVGQRPQQTRRDIAFQLACCQL